MADLCIDKSFFMEYSFPMITTVTKKNMVTIPAGIARKFSIKPGYRLEWLPSKGKDEVLVRIIPDRAILAKRLLGSGKKYSPRRNGVAGLVAEREAEG